MESDGLGLNLALLHVDLITAEDDGDILANADQVAYYSVSFRYESRYTACNRLLGVDGWCARTVPVGDVLVGNSRSNIEHDDTALAVDIVTITEATKLLLTSGIPDVELDLAVVLRRQLARVPLRADESGVVTYGGKAKRVDLDTKGGHVLLLEFTGQVTLDEGGLEKIAG